MSEREFNIVFSKRLKHYLQEYDMTQTELASRLKVSPQSVTNWCKGNKSPRMDKVDAMCEIFHCNRSDLMEEKHLEDKSVCKAISIPVYGRVAARIPLEMIEDIIDTEEIPEDLARTGSFFGLQIHGDSMEPRMKNGDIVIVRQQDDAESDDIVIATVNGTDATCKRLKKYQDGIALISSNPAYDPMYFSNKEIEEKPVRIIGRVVELRAKF